MIGGKIGDRESFFKNLSGAVKQGQHSGAGALAPENLPRTDFMEVRRKKSISLVVRAPWSVREVESYALSKFQPATTLGDPPNVEKTIHKK